MEVRKFIDIPMANWEATYTAMGTTRTQELERGLSGLAVWCARASAYFSRRLSGGKHEDAVKRQNQVAAKVRQALGYTYKEANVQF